MKKVFKKNINLYSRKYRDIKEIMENRFNILIGVIIFLMFIILINLYYLQVVNHDYYSSEIVNLTKKVVYGATAPRGRIYDRNHELIVDNKPVKIIYYKKSANVTTEIEIKVAYKLGELIEVDFSNLTVLQLKNFWLKNNSDLSNSLITLDEWQKLEERKIDRDDIYDLKISRITEDVLNKYNNLDKEAAYIYCLMNVGYSYSEKTIKKNNVTDLEYALVASNVDVLNGINTRLDWEREYLYGSTFKSILGSVSSSSMGLPYELKDYYLEKGYTLNDRVGISNIEYMYEDYLKGKKNSYQLISDGSLKLLEEGNRGNDIVLTIDIKLQKEIELILEENLLKAKSEDNTKYYNRSFVIITNPMTGEVLAMAGKQIIINDDGTHTFYDYTPGVYTSPVVAGSIVKGASHIVGYNTGALKIGEVRYDECVKIASTPIKCSWKPLGKLDDIKALKMSSNTYQYYTAIKVGGGVYDYNKPLQIDKKAFDIYRSTFAEFGLGVKTNIDLPNESLGYRGTNTKSGYLLDFAIGQYDTYTPIQLAQYMGTIANGGSRLQPYLLSAVYPAATTSLSRAIYTAKPITLNKVTTKDTYLTRVQDGLEAVMASGGTGVGYIDTKYKPAGKTGTSQSFIDTDNDNMIDLGTITNTFAGYAPYDNPKVLFVVVSPDITYDGTSDYKTPVNRRISNQVSKKFFEIYK